MLCFNFIGCGSFCLFITLVKDSSQNMFLVYLKAQLVSYFQNQNLGISLQRREETHIGMLILILDPPPHICFLDWFQWFYCCNLSFLKNNVAIDINVNWLPFPRKRIKSWTVHFHKIVFICFRKMHAWCYDEQAIMLLKSLIPRKGELVRPMSNSPLVMKCKYHLYV